MSRLRVSPRKLLMFAVIVGVIVFIEVTPLGGWLSRGGLWAISILAPITFIAVALVGVWSGFKYLRDRGWQS